MRRKIKRSRTWMCALCTDKDGVPLEFDSFEEYSEHNKTKHPKGSTPQVKPKKAVRTPLSEPKPADEPKIEGSKLKEIELTYKYTGVCPNCGVEVETIPLEIDKKIEVVAWCPACKMKRKQRSVAKL